MSEREARPSRRLARESPSDEPRASQRTLTFVQLLALGVNGIVGVGIFFAPAPLAALAPGILGVVAIGLTGLALVPVALAVARLGGRFEDDGGPALYARKAFGETAGFMVGWLAYVSSIFATASVIAALTRAVFDAAGEASSRVLAVALASLLAATAASGTRPSAHVWTALTVAKLLPLFALVGLGALATSAGPVHAAFELPAAMPSVPSFLRAMLTAAFLFQGFEVLPVIAGQARDPKRDIPRAVLLAIGSATVGYLAIELTVVGAIPHLASAESPLVETAEVLGGATWGKILYVGTSVSALGIAFGMVVTTPRYLAAIAQGSRLALVSARGAPLAALLTTWVLVCVVLLAGSLSELFALASLAVILQFSSIAASLARLGWRARFGLRKRDVALAAGALGTTACLLAAAEAKEWLIAASFIASGWAVRRFLPRAKAAPPA